MKKLSLFLFALLSMQLIFAQAPQGIHYQAVLRDGNTVLANKSVDILLGILDANDLIVFEEAHNGLTTDAFGTINYVIGTGTPVIGSLENVDWSQSGLYFLSEATVDGIIYDLGPVNLQSVPYSLHSNFADSAAVVGSVGFADSAAVAGSAIDAGRAQSAAIANFAEYSDSAGVAESAHRLDVEGTSAGQLLRWNGSAWVPSDGVAVSTSRVEVSDEAGATKITMNVGESSEGTTGNIRTSGPTSTNVVIGSLFFREMGFVGTYDSTQLRADINGAGELNVFAANGTSNAQVGNGYFTNTVNSGTVSVSDSMGFLAGGIMVEEDGTSVIFGDVKNFRMTHPNNPDKEIWYASLEGPEAAAYVRGTAEMVNGEGVVRFTEHFAALANTETMTVVLTPLSADSKGMAVVEKTADGFRVKELYQGTGNYQFDWEVKCVRKGYENYQPVRAALKHRMRKEALPQNHK